MAKTTEQRRRIRRPVGSSNTSAVPQEVHDLAVEAARANKRKNAASRAESTAKKKLHAEMNRIGIKHLETTGEIDGKTVRLESDVTIPRITYVDVNLLREIIGDDDKWLECLSATQTSVEVHAGKIAAQQALKERDGEERISVKASK